MMARRVDLERVRTALADLEGAAADPSVSADRTARYLAGQLDGEEAEMKTHPVKVPTALLGRAEALIDRLTAHPELMEWGRVTKTAVVRVALARGLRALEKDLDRREKTAREE